jgi:hypothetical protein
MFTSILALAEKSGLLLLLRPWAVVLGMMATASYFTGSVFLTHERITQENYERIAVGMAKDEVYQILKKPDGREGQKRNDLANYGESPEVWSGERGNRITIHFGDAGRVIDMSYKGPGEEISTEEILWNWFGKWL